MQPDVLAFRPAVGEAVSRRTPLVDLPELLTVTEAALWLGLGRDAAYQLARARGVRVGRYLRVPRRALEELVRP